jgi:hypothetical protein
LPKATVALGLLVLTLALAYREGLLCGPAPIPNELDKPILAETFPQKFIAKCFGQIDHF